jgi:glycosyltransferase involved in cell wall biosynthesis
MPRVSIITRTMDRPKLLSRTLDSILSQRFTDWELVIVNGGSATTLEDVLRPRSDALGGRLKTLQFDNPHPGMRGVPLNHGIAASSGELITILDDDDTWDPDYLESMVAMLDRLPPTAVGGVVCQTRVVEESSLEDGLVLLKDYALNADLFNLTLARVAVLNAFCIHAFVYRRSAFDAVGGYAEDLPVLEDWEFNLRFLARWEIAVVPRIMTHYHLRPAVGSGSEANSQHAEFDRHKFYEAKIINDALRRDTETGRPGLGLVLANAAQTRWLERRIHSVEGKVRAASEKIGKIDARTREMKAAKK